MGNGPSWWRYAAIAVGCVGFFAGLSMLAGTRWILGVVVMCGCALLFSGAVALNVRSARYGRPWTVAASVELTPDEAFYGARKTVTFTARRRCTACDGSGRSGARRCRKCRGSGLGERGRIERTVTVPEGVVHGTKVTLASMGAPGGRGFPAGDLLLSVRIAGGRAAQDAHAADDGRDPRIRPARQRSVQDDAFLVTVVGPGRAHKPADRAEPGVPPKAPRGPVTVLGGREDTEIAVHRTGIRVRDKWPMPGGTARWKVRFEMRWEAIGGLAFDYGSHDSVVALYAIPAGGAGPRQHVVDARAFTDGQWAEVAGGVAGLSGGRLVLDLTRRNGPGPLRDS